MDKRLDGQRKLLLPAMLSILALAMSLGALSPALARAEKAWPVLAPVTLEGSGTGAVHFSQTDFSTQGGELAGIILREMPEGGMLTRGGEPLTAGSVISREGLNTLAFVPDAQAEGKYLTFQVLPVFAGIGPAEQTVTVGLDLTGQPNSAPIACHGRGETYCGLPLAGDLRAIDPDGDSLTYTVLSQPKNGTVTLEGSRFVYTPTGHKARTDAFTYTAVDTRGLQAEAAVVTIKVRAAESGLFYADLQAEPHHFAAVRLAELGILRGEQFGGNHLFHPDEPVTRAQFVTMVSSLCDLPLPTAAVSTGMADNASIPAWAKASMAAALEGALIQGERQSDGNRSLRANDSITRAEAAVILDRMLELPDDNRTAGYADGLPAWAAQAVVNAVEGGFLSTDGEGRFEGAAALTRGEAAGCLYRAYESLHAGESFWDIF